METCNLSVCLTVAVNKLITAVMSKIDKTSFNEVPSLNAASIGTKNSERVLVVFGLFMTLFFYLNVKTINQFSG